jgi:NADPH:quinone reductase-like Zn-dependent oxidoreductase
LIKVEAAPLNPSDLASIGLKEYSEKTLPFTPGIEGSGTVVESGGNINQYLFDQFNF